MTGGTGFIGSHVVERLAKDGHSVSVLRRPDAGTTKRQAHARFVAGDLLDPASLRVACASQDAIVHSAGLVGERGTWQDYQRINVAGTRRLIQAAVATGVSRLVHVSSLVVHAAPRCGESIRETSPLLRQVPGWNHYARSKLFAERIVHRAAVVGRIETTVIRPGLVLGPRDRWTTPWLLRRLLRPALLLVGHGRNVIPCVTVEDLADAVSRAATRPAASSDVFDIAAAGAMTQDDLIASHARAIGRSYSPVGLPAPVMRALAAILDTLDVARVVRPSPSRRTAVAIACADAHVDCSHASTVLGWRGSGSCDDAIHRSVEWEIAHQEGAQPGCRRDLDSFRSEMAT